MQNYPCKGQKTKQREETTAVVSVTDKEGKLLVVQRPKGGECHCLGAQVLMSTSMDVSVINRS